MKVISTIIWHVLATIKYKNPQAIVAICGLEKKPKPNVILTDNTIGWTFEVILAINFVLSIFFSLVLNNEVRVAIVHFKSQTKPTIKIEKNAWN